jgi:GMP synthase (glutamine-hydrolysing)
MPNEKIVILDFGSQYAHLIAKRFRLMGFYSEISQPSAPIESFTGAKGIVFSGGPSSVYEENIPAFNSDILKLEIPILGLCYGHQLMAQEYGGKVEKAVVGEFGIAHLVKKTAAGSPYPASPLFAGISFPAQVWMSHQDAVSVPGVGFELIASTKDCPFAGLQNLAKKRFSLQCHVEVKDTPDGDRILANFASICGMEKNWDQDKVLETIMREIVEAADGTGDSRSDGTLSTGEHAAGDGTLSTGSYPAGDGTRSGDSLSAGEHATGDGTLSTGSYPAGDGTRSGDSLSASSHAASDGTLSASAHKRKVLLFLSGGVDSTVAFALLNKALGQNRVLGLHIDNGFMRKDESKIIERRYKEFGFTNFIVEDASETFLKAVEGETDPQKKRKAIGETFITVRNEVVGRLKLDENDWLLGQGTLYPDIIESGGTKNSHTIKTHHNRVDGIQALIAKGLIIEPLKDLYKDEVRMIGKKIGLSDELVNRQPFPGPGLSINVLCSKGENADAEEFEGALLRLSEIKNALSFTQGSFVGISALPVKSVGVQGDFRTYRFPAVLSFKSVFSSFPSWDELEKASSTITNASKDVNRTVLELWKADYAHASKKNSPEAFSIREGYCDKARLDQTREADNIVLDELKKSGWYTKIFQHLTINLPWAQAAGHCSIVLRPVVSEDVMTARFAHLDASVLRNIVYRIASLGFVDAIYYDITNKPPATFGWE